MIKYEDALRTARSMLGTPYSEMDCIRLIVMIIRKSPGGDPGYRCEGTNWLWRSAENAKKYRHIAWRQEGIENARGGMLAFKRDGDNVHHVGFVTQEGTVIHSSSVHGMVIETQLDGSWQLLAEHRELKTGETPPAGGTSSVCCAAAFRSGEGLSGGAEEESTGLVRSDGVSIVLKGRWRLAQD